MIKATNKITGNLNASIIKQYPELENITITPTLEEQKLKSEKYGFDEIIVQGIPATDLEINPSFEEQVEEGLFKEVRVGAIPQETLNITPTEEEQTKTGIFTEVNIGAIEAVEIDPELNFDATNTIIMQGQDGTYIKKVTIDKPESLKPENIKSGETIFGVTGGLADTSDGTVTSNDVVAGKVAYANNQRVVGTIPDNGELQFAPSDEAQVIPMGLTSGGIVAAADITNLNEYDVCLTLANSLETTEDYQETTATPEDLKEGKTAYSNGERIVGTFKDTSTEAYKAVVSGTNGSAIIEIPDGITAIKQYAFANCDGVSITKIPASVKAIGNYSFYHIGQYNLKTLTIEGDIDSIGQQAFSFSGYNVVLIPNVTKVPTLRHKESFEYTGNKYATIYVPDSLLNSFKSASNWSNLYTYLKPISEYQG